MSALHVVGRIVSTDKIEYADRKTGEAKSMIVSYVVNGGGAPLALRSMAPLPAKPDGTISIPVRASVYNGEVGFWAIVPGGK